MPHKFDAGHKDYLVSPERRELLDPDTILSLLPMEPDQVVADIGSGPGFFTLPLARCLTEGRVIALDIAEEMVAAVREKAAGAGIDNVEARTSGEVDLPVPTAGVDGAFLAFVLHEVEEKATFLERVNASLKPGGWLAVLEWHRRETGYGPPLEARLTSSMVRALARGAGFVVAEEQALNEDHYLLLLDAR